MPNCRVYCRRPRRTHVSPTRGPVKEGDKIFYTHKITLGVRGEDGVRGFRHSEGQWIQITFWAERRVRGFQMFQGPGDYLTFWLLFKGFTDAEINICLYIVWVGVGSIDFYLLGARMELSGGAYSGKQRSAILAVTDKRRYAALPQFASCKWSSNLQKPRLAVIVRRMERVLFFIKWHCTGSNSRPAISHSPLFL